MVIDVARIIELKDAPIVAGAIMLGAPYLASYDRRHLHSQRAVIFQHWGIRVATPEEILRHFRGGLGNTQ